MTALPYIAAAAGWVLTILGGINDNRYKTLERVKLTHREERRIYGSLAWIGIWGGFVLIALGVWCA